MERVILVDRLDNEEGAGDREAVHQSGDLHRAVSVFVFDGDGRLLLQRRASTKALFAGLWANTCCTHPRPGESVTAAAERRLYQEMGMHLRLESIGTFIYRAEDENTGYIEHELDHVLIGRSDDDPVLDSHEADAFYWADMRELRDEVRTDHRYAPWLSLALEVFPDLGA